jgi:hypothetical protein
MAKLMVSNGSRVGYRTTSENLAVLPDVDMVAMYDFYQ